MSDEEIRAKLGDEGVRASHRLYDLYNETEHANRLVEDARYNLRHGNVARALEALKIAKGAADRAVNRMYEAIDALEELPSRPEEP